MGQTVRRYLCQFIIQREREGEKSSRVRCPASEFGKEKELGTELEETEMGNALTSGDEKGMFHVAAETPPPLWAYVTYHVTTGE